MANPQRGEVELKAGDKVYVLRLTFNGICALEEALDMTSSEIDALVRNPAAVRSMHWRAILWACLQDKHSDLQPEDAGLIFDEAGPAETVKAIYAALQTSQPEPKAGAKNPRKEASPAG